MVNLLQQRLLDSEKGANLAREQVSELESMVNALQERLLNSEKEANAARERLAQADRDREEQHGEISAKLQEAELKIASWEGRQQSTEGRTILVSG